MAANFFGQKEQNSSLLDYAESQILKAQNYLNDKIQFGKGYKQEDFHNALVEGANALARYKSFSKFQSPDTDTLNRYSTILKKLRSLNDTNKAF